MRDRRDTTHLRSKAVLLYIPNIIGYIRLALLATAVVLGKRYPYSTFVLIVTNFALDGVDGIIARALNQVSVFGAWLDVAIDNISRGAIWCWAVQGPLAVIPISVEFLTFAATQEWGGAAWKTGCFNNAPSWVAAVMRNGFKSPAGILSVAGLFGMPLWLWSRRFLPEFCFGNLGIGAVLLAGRLLAASVEGWVLYEHLKVTLQEDAYKRAD
ncbi:hypothetical protein CVIRNUC_003107 [Coccomyxa viridis]|uniref:CDP-diacylglycerol--inositol 3-phosphatidyltransferase n=1 Tax=Coccomyxa viridis TaxID=1274662 RepID=A0AAV1HZI8_9CHLO|nr:hypothetical protein CVIRNUC_003107 [Coccomyxa viridis]